MEEITAKLSTALANRYRIERHLGEGGMATVYLAEDLKHKRKVAVKVLRPELAAVLGGERFTRRSRPPPICSIPISSHCSIHVRPTLSFITSCRSSITDY